MFEKLAVNLTYIVVGSVEVGHKHTPARKVPVMAFRPLAPTTVFVAKPFEVSYADAMRGLRIWLDYKKLQPTSFRITTEGRIGFEISFSTERDVADFGPFAWPDD